MSQRKKKRRDHKGEKEVKSMGEGVAQLFSDSNKLVRVSEQIWFKVPVSPLSSRLIKSYVPEVGKCFTGVTKQDLIIRGCLKSSIQGDS